jgi:hypothetical protein
MFIGHEIQEKPEGVIFILLTLTLCIKTSKSSLLFLFSNSAGALAIYKTALSHPFICLHVLHGEKSFKF